MPHNISSSSVNGFTAASETKFKQHRVVIRKAGDDVMQEEHSENKYKNPEG